MQERIVDVDLYGRLAPFIHFYVKFISSMYNRTRLWEKELSLHPRLYGICNWLSPAWTRWNTMCFPGTHPCKCKNYPWKERTSQEHLPDTVPGTCAVAAQRSGDQSHWTHMECSSLKVQTFSSPGSGRGRNTGHTIVSWTQPGWWIKTDGRHGLR